MSPGSTVIELPLPGLSEAEKRALQRSLGKNVQFKSTARPDESEFTGVEIAVVYVSVAALQALTAFLLKRRNRTQYRQAVHCVRPDGTVEERVLEITTTSSDPPDAKVLREANLLKELGSLTGLDPTAPS